MSYEWEKIRLGDVSKVITDKIEISEINKKNYISTENMLPNFEGVVPASTIPNAKKVNAFRAKDILFSNIRTYFKKVWYATMDGGCSADVLVFRPKNSAIDNQFLSYVLKNEKFISHTVTTSKGTKMPRGDKKAIMNYQFYKPNLIDQQKITHILSALDDKIELNKKINQTLESIAQTIFKSWFVDFDPVHAKANAQSEDEYDAIAKELGISREILDLFPSEFEESELGLIPKGWEVDEIGNIINLVGGGTPSTKNKDFWDGGNVNWSTPKDLSSLDFPVLLDTERKITEQGLKKISSGLLEEGTLLLSSRAPIGYMAISKIPVAINQGFIAIPPNQKLSSIFLLYWTKNNIDVIKSYSGGTTFQEISKKNFRLIKLILPSANLLDAFNKLASNLFNSIVMKEMENKSLQEIRDNLLPKLLSGEIDVSNLNLGPEDD
ncbi:restriction endonuclease subunit S [Legionella longbeachae]|uniref:restriction endonuclease subunit S n=1 Tax=Legionella longbeachae TaxID=450 RepID=UPI0012486472|nr:restriction endonuclease subunit S [Legionella longbeachae]QEY51387.1 restriction endonuclease subunit S [Legionella longbeachae]